MLPTFGLWSFALLCSFSASASGWRWKIGNSVVLATVSSDKPAAQLINTVEVLAAFRTMENEASKWIMMLLCAHWVWKRATVGLFTQVTKPLMKMSLISLTFKVWMSRLFQSLLSVRVLVCGALMFNSLEKNIQKLLFSHNKKIKTCKNVLICNPNYTYTRIQDISMSCSETTAKRTTREKYNLYMFEFTVSSQLKSTREH